MGFINVISAIGNNSSVWPLLVRDCGIEIPTKVMIARQENLKESRQKANDATREWLISEYGTSAIWLGGIPLVEFIADKFIKKKGYNSEVNLKLFENDKEKLQGADINLDKFKNSKLKSVQDALKDLEKAKANKPKFEKMIAKKFAAAIIIPTAIMGFVLPPLNFALTRKLREKRQKEQELERQNKATTFNGNFGGGFVSTVANFTVDTKMALTDGGLTVGRVTTSRNKDEAMSNGFKMIGSMILNFVIPKYIAKYFDKGASKLFNTDVSLDPLILDSKEFIAQIKEGKVDMPKSVNKKELLEFIDNNPNSIFSKSAQRLKIVSYLTDDGKEFVRDPRKYVDLGRLEKLYNDFKSYIDKSVKSGNIERFAKKAKAVKCGNIIANVGISSFLLAVMLPKAQYQFNKFLTGSYSDPGLREDNKLDKKA